RGTTLGHVTDPAGGAAFHCGALEAVRWAVVAHPITALGEVANLGCRAAHGRALDIRWTGITGARAGLSHITGAGCCATHCAGGLEAGSWTGGAHPIAGLRPVTSGPRRGAADRVRGLELTGVGATGVRWPVRSQVTLLAACNQAIATDGRTATGLPTAAVACLDGAGAGAAVPACGVAVITLLAALYYSIAAAWSVTANLGHKGVVEAAIEGQVRPHSHRKGRLGGFSEASDIGIARGVHGDAIAIVSAVAAKVAGIVQGGAIGTYLGHQGVVGAIVGQIRPHSYRKGIFGGLGNASDIGIARRVHGDAVALVVVAAANVAGIDQGGAISPHLGYKGVFEAVAVFRTVEG